MAKYTMGQEIPFTLREKKSIGDIVIESISENEVYYFEITDTLPDDSYKGKLVGINGYMKTIM
jgi:hypothetical protein